MSTKNLARTVIEGGRAFSNCWMRRASHATARAHERDAEREALVADADAQVWPRARHVGRYFHDKLSPAERWMRAQVGRPWDRVRGDLFATFDTRTLAGRHIVFDHMLPRRYDQDEWRVSGDWLFRVDAHGILRARPRPRWHRELGPSAAEQRAACVFRDGRYVGVRGTRLYWMVPVRPHEPGAATHFRQDRALTDAERATFEAFEPRVREEITMQLG